MKIIALWVWLITDPKAPDHRTALSAFIGTVYTLYVSVGFPNPLTLTRIMLFVTGLLLIHAQGVKMLAHRRMRALAFHDLMESGIAKAARKMSLDLQDTDRKTLDN